jgi:hypothetical protein
VEVKRTEDTNTLVLRVFLEYTGGGLIHHFRIAFRQPEADIWAPLGNFTASAINNSKLAWTAQIVDDRFQHSRVELWIEVVNSNNHISSGVPQLEEIGRY